MRTAVTRRAIARWSVALLGLSLCACSDAEKAAESGAAQTDDSPYPPTAKVAVHEGFLDDLAAVRHPSDGGGRVWLVHEGDSPPEVVAGSWGRWTLRYEAGELGVVEGGAVIFLTPPFWGWSSPQSTAPERPGYTTATTSAEGVELELEQVERNLLRAAVRGRELREGETIDFVFGAGPALAKADDFAEAQSFFWLRVDGDGDGVSELVPGPASVTILPGPPARMRATLSSTAAPDSEARLTLAVMDVMASSGCRVEGTVSLTSIPEGLELPTEVVLAPDDRGHVTIPVRTTTPGIYRVSAKLVSTELEAQTLSNPIHIAEGETPLYWGDLHGHSHLSDGTGTPEDFFRYARDIAALDFAVLTDHDHFGVEFLDAHPEMWRRIREAVESHNEPERFVTVLGYEWTSWLYGHRHVLYFDGQGEVLSSVGGVTTTPSELWEALRGRDALTFAHHSAGGPVATDWSFAPDPILEPVTEIASSHGSSEASDSPSRIYNAVPGGFVLGFIGSGDGHDGHPGHTHLSPNYGYRRTRPDPLGRRAEERMGNGGLAGVRATDLTPEALLKAFRSRRVYATSGPRIWLAAALNGRPIGSSTAAAEFEGTALLQIQVSGTSGIEHIDVIRREAPVQRQLCEGRLDVILDFPIEGLSQGDYVYVRVLQNDGAQAWTSPFFIK